MSNVNATLSRIAGLTNKYREATAKQGFGAQGWWPCDDEKASSEFPCLLRGIKVVEDDKLNFWGDKANPQAKASRQSVPALSIQFLYSYTDAMDTKNWDGRPIYIPLDTQPGSLSRNGNIEVDINLGRLKGCAVGLGFPEDIALDALLVELLKQQSEREENGTQMNVNVFCERRENKSGNQIYVEKSDYIRETLSV